MLITCNLPDELVPINTPVYLPRPQFNTVQEDKISGYYCVLLEDEGQLKLTPTDYRLSTLNVGRGELTDKWKRDEFFLSYDEAMSMAVEYEVVATSDEWFKAIGLSGGGQDNRYDITDDCELPICCANISDIRDLLYNVCVSGKINGVTKRNLIALLNSHEPPVNKPVLDKILAQLNINWTPIS